MHPPRPQVLISDDDPDVLAILTRQARAVGLGVIRDHSSQAAVLARLKPDAIVLDLGQPIDGVLLLEQLKADPETRTIPVIVITGGDDEVARSRCLALGVHEFANKPLDRMFMARVARVATRFHARAIARAPAASTLAPT